jgi:hypothetical protein
VAVTPTIYIITSDTHRNGKTTLARLVADYLLLDGHDPFLIDTDAPDGPLRNYFPGRTALADFSKTKGQMKLFDTILNSPGRDYVVDLPLRHAESFFAKEKVLGFFAEAKKVGFRIFVFFVVDNTYTSLNEAKIIRETKGIDLFVPVRNMLVGSTWSEDEASLTLPAMSPALAQVVLNRRFSFRNFVQGDLQGLPQVLAMELQNFLYEALNNLNNLEPVLTLDRLREF